MRWKSFCLLAALLPAAVLLAQADTRESGLDRPSGPAAISGIASSARHCISGNAANVHNLGWVGAQSTYTVQFEADFGLVARVVRFEPAERRAGVISGTPEFNFVASNSGTLVLHVSGNGQPGCYRYKAVIGQPAASIAVGDPEAREHEPLSVVAERRSAPAQSLAITGTPSSAQHCVAGNLVSNVHEIGRVDQQSSVAITLDTDFDAIVGATMTSLDPNAGAGSFVVTPESGGSRNPSLSFTAEAGANIVLFVAGFNGAAGCYKYKVEIR